MKNELKFGDLTPRAIAALCALRIGPKTSNQLGTAIGDGRLLIDMVSAKREVAAAWNARHGGS